MIHMRDNFQSKPKTRNSWLWCLGSSREWAQFRQISPDLSLPEAQLLLTFWWAPLQRTFEEGFEDEAVSVFACLCDCLHAVEAGME